LSNQTRHTIVFLKATNSKEGEEISIFHLDGRLLKTLRLDGAKTARVSGLPAGVYMVKAKGLRLERMPVE
jgi:hypothetical protein